LASAAKPLSEAWLSRVWQSQLVSAHGLITSEGQPVQVVYPGRRNREAGPDFSGAIISLNSAEPQSGDVELHLCSSQWQEHRHHCDPAYNRVILHVVLRHDCATPTPLQSGSLVPVLPLDGHLDHAGRSSRCLSRTFPEPCPLRARRKTELARLLDAAGEERFFKKASAFRADMDTFGPGQALYKGVMRALGYAHNKEPFQELAQQVPLAELERRAREESPLRACLVLQARLIGGAGLLPQQRGLSLGEADLGSELERIWHPLGCPQVLSPQNWRWRGVRPENWPMRRLAAASYLLTDNSQQGLLATVLGSLAGFRPTKLEEAFLVLAQGYWADHYDFGVAGARGAPLIGRGRAAEITVNVALPFAWAWGQIHRQPELAKQTLELYRSYPRLAENQVTRLMKELFFPRGGPWPKSACQQQGLLHLYHSFCLERKCSPCYAWRPAQPSLSPGITSSFQPSC